MAIDPATGATQTIGNTNIASLMGGVSTFNPATGEIYVSTDLGNTLGIIDAETGQTTLRPVALPTGPAFFEWDPATNRIITVTSFPTARVQAIDPVTGNVETLLTPVLPDAVVPNLSAFDPATRRLFFVVGVLPSPQLVVVDLNTASVAVRPFSQPHHLLVFHWDPVTGRIVAVGLTSGFRVMAIDPDTGAVTSLFATNAPNAQRNSAIDPVNRRLYFLTGASGSPFERLVVVDLAAMTTAVRELPLPISSYAFLEVPLAAHVAVPLSPAANAALLAALVIAGLFVMRRGA